MTNPIGPLVPADEGLCHQITDTFAVVGTSDLSWTEKICAMAAAKDGSLQLGFGLGKYPNRNVMDGYAGISRGVRAAHRAGQPASRRRAGAARHGPDPLRGRRAPAFGAFRPRGQRRAADRLRLALRGHRAARRSRTAPTCARGSGWDPTWCATTRSALASGWVEVEGVRTEISPDTWVSTRDHSWGVRYDVGLPPRDLEPRDPLAGLVVPHDLEPHRHAAPRRQPVRAVPALPDRRGTRFHPQAGGHGRGRTTRRDGRALRRPRSRRSPSTPSTAGCGAGPSRPRTADGSVRTLEIEAVSDTGFHLGAGLYFGLDGHHHGEWRGDLHVEGEHIPDCADPAVARRLHQIRDTVVHVVDPRRWRRGMGQLPAHHHRRRRTPRAVGRRQLHVAPVGREFM